MAVQRDFKVWDGVYTSFGEAPAEGPGFEGAIWQERSLEAARETLGRVQAGAPPDYALRQRNSVLPTLITAILNGQPRANILDFGGGLGTGFMVLINTVPGAAERLDYSVVEVDGMARTGSELFAGHKGPNFLTRLPDSGSFDVVHAASVMQYVEDWRTVIARLADYGATYLSFADMFIGPFETYVTLQNYYGSRIRHWFFNAGDYIDEVKRHGYSLILRCACDAKILGDYGPLPMENFSPQLRIPHTSHLLFSRRSVGA